MKRENRRKKSFKTKEDKRDIRVGGGLAEAVVEVVGVNVITVHYLREDIIKHLKIIPPPISPNVKFH